MCYFRANDKPLVGDYDCTNCNKIYDAVDTVRIYTSKDYGKGFDKSELTFPNRLERVCRLESLINDDHGD